MNFYKLIIELNDGKRYVTIIERANENDLSKFSSGLARSRCLSSNFSEIDKKGNYKTWSTFNLMTSNIKSYYFLNSDNKKIDLNDYVKPIDSYDYSYKPILIDPTTMKIVAPQAGQNSKIVEDGK